MAPPKISVVIAVFNGGKTLERAINSFVTQKTRQHCELIVIDGASSDNTVEILRRHSSQLSHWVSEPDNGIYDAWNKALSLAQGDWICFIGADDELLPTALSDYQDAILKAGSRNIQYISSRVQMVLDGRPVRIIGKPWSWPLFQKYMTVAHVGSLHHVSLYQQVGTYDTTYRICGDYELLLRAGNRLQALFLDKVTVKMAAGGVALRSIAKTLAETERAKVQTAKRGKMLSAFERRWAHTKAVARSLFY